jgi:hypothetical protein
MGTLALRGPLAPRDVHPRDDRKVCGHTLGVRADRSGGAGEYDGVGRRGGDPACLVRPFASLPRTFLEDRTKVSPKAIYQAG